MEGRSRIISFVGWSAVDYFFRYGLNIIIVVFLARMLNPEDFGLVGMLTLFTAIANIFIDSGFSQSLIQRQNTTRTDESSIFYFNIMMGVVSAVCLCLAAPLIASFYHQPILRSMLYFMALNLFISSFGSIHTTLLTKMLDFKTIARSGIVANLISGILAILMAYFGFGVWSLVAQILVMTTSSVLLLWLWHPWRPGGTFSILSLRSHFRFGGFLLVASILNNFYMNSYSMIIGKLFQARDVGYFTRADRLQQIPMMVMTNVIGRVAFPLLSKKSDNSDALLRGMRRATMIVMFFNIPIMVLIVMLPEQVVLIILGKKWLPAAQILVVLGVGGFLWPLHALNLNVLKAQGRSDLNVKLMIIKITIGVALLLMASPFGLVAIAWSQVLSSVFSFIVNTYYTGYFINYGAYAQIKDLAPYFLSAVPMVIVVWLIKLMHSIPLILSILLSIILGGLAYLGVCKMFRLGAYQEMTSVVLGKR